jgi:hypothetical protein
MKQVKPELSTQVYDMLRKKNRALEREFTALLRRNEVLVADLKQARFQLDIERNEIEKWLFTRLGNRKL